MRRFDNIEPLANTLRAFWNVKHDTNFDIDTSYGIDGARSHLIENAKKEGADRLIMVDSDVAPETPLSEILSYAHQAFSRNYCAVVSPTLSYDRRIMAWAPKGSPPYLKPEDVPFDKLAPVEWAALGFVVIDGKALEVLKTVGTQPYLNAAPKPLYCRYTPEEGEDHSLLRNLAESTGKQVGIDGRIKVIHTKLQGIQSWRGQAY